MTCRRAKDEIYDFYYYFRKSRWFPEDSETFPLALPRILEYTKPMGAEPYVYKYHLTHGKSL